jgi:hypothetical protein
MSSNWHQSSNILDDLYNKSMLYDIDIISRESTVQRRIIDMGSFINILISTIS